MEKPCPFWQCNRECSSKECGVGYCDDEVPAALRNNVFNSAEQMNEKDESSMKCESSNQFDPLDTSLSEAESARLKNMEFHEETDDTKFCDVDGKYFLFLKKLFVQRTRKKIAKVCYLFKLIVQKYN